MNHKLLFFAIAIPFFSAIPLAVIPNNGIKPAMLKVLVKPLLKECT
jgi:hypothetical protein